MKKYLYLLGIMILLISSCGNYKKQKKGLEVRATEASDRIDNFFKTNDSKKTPGYAILVLEENEVIHSAGYGMANFEEELAISPMTTFWENNFLVAASMISILRLEDQGVIDLDDRLTSHLPELRNLVGRNVTLRHLLDSTVGFPWFGDYYEDKEFWDGEILLDYLSGLEELAFEPGTSATFSNIEAILLMSIIIERQTGKDLVQYVTEGIIDPLNLTNTKIITDPETTDIADVYNFRRRTDGYVPKTIYDNVVMPSSYTNLNDLAIFYKALDGGELLSEEQMEVYYARTTRDDGTVIEDPYNDNPDYYTGYWLLAGYESVEAESGLVAVADGNGNEYGTVTVYFPEQEVRIFLYSNLPSSNGFNLLFRSFIPLMSQEWM